MSNYERGERIPTVDVCAKIANALNVSMDELCSAISVQIPCEGNVLKRGMEDLKKAMESIEKMIEYLEEDKEDE